MADPDSQPNSNGDQQQHQQQNQQDAIPTTTTGTHGQPNETNPFTLTPDHLSKLIEPKSITHLHQLGGITGLTTGLQTDPKAGLSLDADPSARKRVFGTNILPDRKSKSFLALAWIALQDRVLILLSVAAAVSLALGLYQTFDGHHSEEEGSARVEWIEGVAIIVAIVVVVVVGALNDWQKERQFRKLNKKKEDRYVTLVRSGRAAKVSVHDVLVGDVMVLETGDVIPVDGVLIEGHGVSCDEASATGESDIVKKMPAKDAVAQAAVLMEGEETGMGDGIPADKAKAMAKLDPFLLSGARVLDGVGTFLVTAVGPHSSFGRTMMALRNDPGMTPLQARLNILAGYIAKLGSAAGLLLFTVLFIEFLARLPGNPASGEEKGQSFLRILITAITIIVVAVPEGLPLAVTLSLAFATKKMTRENNLVRHLQSCETMGNATVVATDKTGTLTANVMTIVGGRFGTGSLIFGDRDLLPASSSDANESEKGEPPKQLPTDEFATASSPDFRDLVRDSIAINTTAFEGEEKGKPVYVGTKTETALLDWAKRSLALGPVATERANHPLVEAFPFNSRRKCMGSVIELPPSIEGGKGKYRLLVKGAPEVVLAQCQTTVTDPKQPLSDTLAPLQKDDKLAIEDAVSQYASLSLRTLALAYRDFESWPPGPAPQAHLKVENEKGGDIGDENHPEDDLADRVFRDMTWIGVVAIQDPVREGVPDAVRACARASVSVKMVTGDKVETARAIARECGIITDTDTDGQVMEGLAFRSMSEAQRRAAVRDLRVLARSSPEDKRVLVEALRSLGEVVAVTGDGTNDAPALKAADVGFSMGIMGTEVAKEASDIILMDDNFSSIVKALAWGRAINDAVKKFLQFQITVNITAVVLTFVSAVASDEERSVLNAIQLLWVNLIMDTFAALALATDPPTSSLLDRSPEPRKAPLINLTMWKMILGQSIYQLAVCLTLHFAGPTAILPSYPEPELRTLVFNTFVFMQIFKLVNSRRIDNKLNIFEGLHRNHLFMLMMGIMTAGQVLIIFFGGDAFVVVRLNGAQWGISLVLGFLSIPVGIVIRLVPDRWLAAVVRRMPRVHLKFWRRKGDKKEDVEEGVVVGGEDGDGEGDTGQHFGGAMWEVRDDLAFLKKVRGGRIAALSEAMARHPSTNEGKTAQHRGRSKSVTRSAVGMPGLLAASIAAMPPATRPASTRSCRSAGANNVV